MGIFQSRYFQHVSWFPMDVMRSQNLKKLDMMGEYQLPDDYKPAIKVEVNPEEKL